MLTYKILTQCSYNQIKIFTKDSLSKIAISSFNDFLIWIIVLFFCFNTLLVELFYLTVECLTVPLWYKQQVTFLHPKFD